MKNRVLGAAIVAAAMAGGVPGSLPGSQAQAKPGSSAPQVPGMSLMQQLAAIAQRQQSVWWGGYTHTYPRRGWSVAEGKRRARRARNRLRAKGKHRRAVR